MQTTTNPEADIPTPILMTIFTLLIPCATPAFVLLAGPPEWSEANWHVLHVYTAIMLSLLSGLYGVHLWKTKLMKHQQSTTCMRLSLGPALLACVSLFLPAVIGIGALLLGFVGFKITLACQAKMPVRVPQWYRQLGEQFAVWAMIFLGIALGTNLL